MATATRRPHTPEDLLAIRDRPLPDLVAGEFVERAEMGLEAAEIVCAIIALLKAYAKAITPGIVTGPDGGYCIFPDDPGRVRFPDAAFTRKERAGVERAPRAWGRFIPDLVVEVISPNDHAEELRSKVRDFLDAGVPLVWVVNPETRDVEVLRADRSAALLTEADEIDGGAALPGFRCRVAEFFE
jgi:Uma2 family endonuclease